MANTIPQLFFEQAEKLSDKALFLTKKSSTSKYSPISWKNARRDVVLLAQYLISRGIDAGDRLLILSENRAEWAIADIAIQSTGAWSVPVYPSLKAVDIETIAQDCQPVLAFASNSQQVDKLLQVSEKVDSLKTIVVMDRERPNHSSVCGWPEALMEGKAVNDRVKRNLKFNQSRIQPDNTATLIYTSGTTGIPKGVMLSHRNFLSNVEACLQVTPIGAKDTHLSFLPLCHVFERMAGWYLMLQAGATIAYAETMDSVGANMLEVKPTVMLGVPRFFEKLYDRIQEATKALPQKKRNLIKWAIDVNTAFLGSSHPGWGLRIKRSLAAILVLNKLKAKLGGRLRFFVSGGAPLSSSIGEFFYKMGVTILEGYGLTETSPVIAVNRLERPKFGTVGPLLPNVKVKIADDGEILTQGPHIMQGYYNKEESTRRVIIDGWFHTGDIGEFDEDGCLKITDRKKDLIKTAGGKFIAPQKIEGIFALLPEVSQALVYGDKQPYCVALIIPDFAKQNEIADKCGAPKGLDSEAFVACAEVQSYFWRLVEEAQANLPRFEQVKKIALLSSELTLDSGDLTPTLKMKRKAVAERYAPLLKSLYSD